MISLWMVPKSAPEKWCVDWMDADGVFQVRWFPTAVEGAVFMVDVARSKRAHVRSEANDHAN